MNDSIPDDELLSLFRSGFIPGPGEKELAFLNRVKQTKEAFFKLGEGSIPPAHYAFVKEKLGRLFGFSPDSLPAFYSNRALTPWQGAAVWVENGQVIAIQLRKAFAKGSFLGIYRRSEILSHEAVHAARSAFPNDPWEEFFAFMTSDSKWRQVLGPIVQRPFEVWPFFLFSVGGVICPPFFLGAAVWLLLGLSRLIRFHWILRKASETLLKKGYGEETVRSVLLCLEDSEIRLLAKEAPLSEKPSLRWRLVHLLTDVGPKRVTAGGEGVALS